MVKYFELKTVVCQTNSQFVSILNRIRTCEQTDEDISYINATCYKPRPNNPTLPHLFQRNSTVDEHNKSILDYLPMTLYVLEAIDHTDTTIDITPYHVEKTTLPTTIFVKQGILIELIAGNLDTQDGLVNGADGIFQLHTTQHHDIVWIEFCDPHVGRLCREQMHNLYTDSIPNSWTPITRITRKIKTSSKTITSSQYPIQLACARTIYRAQGLTMDAVAFDPH